MRAFITGITGQTGSYLAEFLLEKGYEVVGLARRTSTPSNANIDHIKDRLTLLSGDLSDQNSLFDAMREARPDEVYNLGAQSYVAESWNTPTFTGDVTGLGVTRMLEAVRRIAPWARFYQASSSEMFGDQPAPQGIHTPLKARSPYASAKIYGHQQVQVFRDSYELYAVSGISFNHESPRRGLEFVTRKVCRAAALASKGKLDKLPIGNIDSLRDWGYAKDYVEGMWLMLQRDEPKDYVLATGTSHSVRELLEQAFSHFNLDYKDFIYQDPSLMRPAEVPHLRGVASPANHELGWKPRTTFSELVALMCDSEASS